MSYVSKPVKTKRFRGDLTMANIDSVMDYIIGGVLGLLVLFSLAPTVLDQYSNIDFTSAPVGVEQAVGATLIVFFVLVVYNLYKNI